MEIIELKCPGCGAPVTRETTKCKYCHIEMLIKNSGHFCNHRHDVEDMASVSDHKVMQNEAIVQDNVVMQVEKPAITKNFFVVILLTLFIPLGFQYLYLGDKKSFIIRLVVFMFGNVELIFFLVFFGLYLLDMFRLLNGYYKKNYNIVM